MIRIGKTTQFTKSSLTTKSNTQSGLRTGKTLLAGMTLGVTFATGADGFVPGEGVGAVLLKPLRHAVVDADHIYAVIRGTSINHGGKTNGFTVPSPRAQREVVAAAMAKSQVSARTISYIEAHGTGTELGDPIEVAGLSQAFRQSTADKQFCAIGSVKTNIGHLEAAAGIAGLTKVLLQMQHRLLVPSLDAERPNPNIEFSTTPFIVQQECAEWKRPMISVDGEMQEYPRIAGVNSFGAGGSNAHLIVEEFSADRSPSQSALPLNTPALIVLSAKHQNRLAEQVRRLLSAMDSGQFDDADLADIAYTLQTGREAMEHRLALTAGTLRELSAKLREFLADGKTSAVESGTPGLASTTHTCGISTRANCSPTPRTHAGCEATHTGTSLPSCSASAANSPFSLRNTSSG